VASRVEVLEIEYGTARDFSLDYRANLSNGGVFVATERIFAPREFVVVRLRLPWCNRMIDLEGEVVHIVPAEMAGVGGRPGVAVQFREPPAGIRGRLGPLCTADVPPAPAPAADESRREPRKSVRVEVHLESGGGAIRGRTRNLSHSGVLVDVSEGSAANGERVRATLKNPANRDEIAIDGVVVRAAQSAGRISTLAVQFDADAARRSAVAKFIEALQEGGHTRRLGAISGPIGELGAQSVVQMFSTTARRGTIYLRHGEEEGVICFDGGVLRAARIGPLSGMKALVRILGWDQGTFEFQSSIDEVAGVGEAPLPLQAALLEATRHVDESRRSDSTTFPLQARLVARHASEGQFTGALGKLEEALLDVAQAGFTVQRALEVIPEPDSEVFRALRSLIDAGMVELR
jgi:Tfp pilus assembly protein PilZ